MMRGSIDRSNYELWFLDYLDGILESDEIAMLHDFLHLNPDLREELENFDEVNLLPDEVNFLGKNQLKKIPLEAVPLRFSDVNQFFIAKLEGDLDENEEQDFEIFLINYPEKVKEFVILKNTFLKPDLTIAYPVKKDLKKSVLMELPSGFAGFDEFMVAGIEGDLTGDGQKLLYSLLENDREKKNEFELLKHTILTPDVSITFPAKSALKRYGILFSARKMVPYLVSVAAAASILLFVFIRIINTEQPSKGFDSLTDNLIFKQNSENNHSRDLASLLPGYIETVSENTEKRNLPEPKNIHLIIPNSSFEKKNNMTQEESELFNRFLEKLKYSERKLKDVDINPDNKRYSSAKSPYLGRKNMPLEKIAGFPDTYTEELKNEEINTPEQTPVVISQIALNQYIANTFREKVLEEKPAANTKLTFWDFVAAGVKGIGKISGKRMQLQREYDQDGKLIEVAFNSPKFGFSAPVKK
jgi:hypothetical protein